MKCKYYEKCYGCINHHNNTAHCKFADCDKFDDCYYNPANYQFCQK